MNEIINTYSEPIEKIALAPAEAARSLSATRSLAGMDRTEMAEALASIGFEKFRLKQVWQWVYHYGVTDFALMTNIAKPAREKLAAAFTLERPAVSRSHDSIDGTKKWLLKFADGNEVESVHIPEEERGTLCVSSQVGCTLSCTFCHTGTQRLVRNLSAEEIVAQVMVARDGLLDWPSSRADRSVSNIVMMGMGEPLYNYENVAKALKVIMDDEGIAISKRRITLSTSGVVPMIERCGAELGVNLAISLHAVRDELRDHLVPLNKKYPIAQLMQACRDYPTLTNARRITFEYVMLKGVNDSDADARALVALLKDIPAKVNLIPFNPWPGSSFERSSNNRIRAFSDIVFEAGYSSPVRKPRGEDILAACGQLKSESERVSKSKIVQGSVDVPPG